MVGGGVWWGSLCGVRREELQPWSQGESGEETSLRHRGRSLLSVDTGVGSGFDDEQGRGGPRVRVGVPRRSKGFIFPLPLPSGRVGTPDRLVQPDPWTIRLRGSSGGRTCGHGSDSLLEWTVDGGRNLFRSRCNRVEPARVRRLTWNSRGGHYSCSAVFGREPPPSPWYCGRDLQGRTDPTCGLGP